MNKIVVSILLVLVVFSGGLGYYSYTLNQQLYAFQQEQASRISAISDNLTNIRNETLAKISGLEGKLTAEMSITQTRIGSLENKIGETAGAVSVLEDNMGDALAKISTIEGEVRETTAGLSQTVIDASNIYRKASQATVRVSDGDRTIGSGFIMDNEAHVVTAYHVVDGLANIYIILPDGRSYKATIAGVSQDSDVAVLTLAGNPDIEPLPMADSAGIRIGEPVVAIGNPFDLTETLTAGIVSQINRYEEVGYNTQSRWVANLIQFDAAANPGNSGCPLINSKGEVIGLVIARVDPGEGDGIYYAVSSNKVKKVAASLIEKGSFDYPWLGVNIANLTPKLAQDRNLPTMNGALVAGITPDSSPAAKAGIKTDDIILAIDGIGVRDLGELTSYLGVFKSPGELATLKIRRGSAEQEVIVEIGKRP